MNYNLFSYSTLNKPWPSRSLLSLPLHFLLASAPLVLNPSTSQVVLQVRLIPTAQDNSEYHHAALQSTPKLRTLLDQSLATRPHNTTVSPLTSVSSQELPSTSQTPHSTTPSALPATWPNLQLALVHLILLVNHLPHAASREPPPLVKTAPTDPQSALFQTSACPQPTPPPGDSTISPQADSLPTTVEHASLPAVETLPPHSDHSCNTQSLSSLLSSASPSIDFH